ncbi:MAG: hypothetical protein IKH45_06305 [Neisseriaceae bacterium]|nr:hypothetical protein [Neisseriaceae bacterium]
MFKKIILSFIFVIFVYILSCAWAMDWIDNQKIENQFFSKKQKSIITLNIAKTIWQITPAFNREKDAERALKISQLYLDSFSVYSNKDNMINILKKNYYFLFNYYDKHEYKISDKLNGKSAYHRLILLNRSLVNVKTIDRLTANIFLNHLYKDNVEIMWVWYFGGYERGFNDGLEKINENLQNLNEKYNTKAFDIIKEYHLATKLCFDKHLSRENADKHNIESQKIFQQIQQKLTLKSGEFQLLNNYLNEEHSIVLILAHLISSNQTECEKEAKNFADKMVELANQ